MDSSALLFLLVLCSYANCKPGDPATDGGSTKQDKNPLHPKLETSPTHTDNFNLQNAHHSASGNLPLDKSPTKTSRDSASPTAEHFPIHNPLGLGGREVSESGQPKNHLPLTGLPNPGSPTEVSIRGVPSDPTTNPLAQRASGQPQTHISPASMMNDPVEIDGDDKDIDDFNFEIDELDKEEININSNTISPKDWVAILDNYNKVLLKHAKDAKALKAMEEELVKRNKEDFEDNEPEKIQCAAMEFNLLTYIKALSIKEQNFILDVDKDGVADFNFGPTSQKEKKPVQ